MIVVRYKKSLYFAAALAFRGTLSKRFHQRIAMGTTSPIQKQLRFISLFAGCGGLDLGFIQEGFQNIGAFDIDANALKVHHHNLQSPTFVHDLLNGLPSSFGRPRAEVLLAGAPCQGFSTLGKRLLDDPRNNLLVEAGKLAVCLSPDIFVAENVPAVLSGPHRKYWKALDEVLRSAEYKTMQIVCDATHHGVSQTRRRVFLIAWRGRAEINLQIPARRSGILRDVISNINGALNHNLRPIPKGSQELLIAKRIGPGQKLSNARGGARAVHTWDIPEVYGRTSSGERKVLELILHLRRRERIRAWGDADPLPMSRLHREFGKAIIDTLARKGYLRRLGTNIDLTNTFNGKYRRLSWDEPSKTVDTRFGSARYYLHPSEHRGFTVREAARIQGFPDSYHFLGSESHQFQMIGNAVPPPLARCVAAAIRGTFFSLP